MFSKKNESVEDRITRVFDELDDDGDGTIPLSKVRNLLSENSRQVDLKDAQIVALLKEADKNHDNVLDLTEFMLLITSSKAQDSRKKRILYRIADTVIARTERPFVHTYIDEYSCLPPPLFIILISLAQVFVFLYYYVNEKGSDDESCPGCWQHRNTSNVFEGRVPGLLLFAPALRAQVWRFLTYQFLHQGFLHLIPNIVLQLALGIPLELVHKSWRIAPLYLFAVCLGALLQYVLDPSIYLVGCSAGLYALIFAHVSNVIINWSEMPFRIVRLSAIILFIVYDLGGTLYRRLFVSACDRVSYSAHIGGAVTGLLMGIVLLYNLKVVKWERILMLVCTCIYSAIFLYVTAMCIFIEPFSKPLWKLCLN
uniref:Rhomboid protease n=1 Tax=Syphacia muris TaxID=451379 RepID=A0A0N5AXS1_9BILA